jgi:2-oxoglutarate/2-oxoacid ferredoxin oxidoreductase subunit alpha
MLEIPLILVNVQRGGPSTGLPTKTEQADLLQAVYGRNGEAPMPVLAAFSPSDCFDTVLEACKIAIEHMTPVFFLSDGFIANGAEPWKFPQANNLPTIKPDFAGPMAANEKFLPYKRDHKLARKWAVPGTPGLEHRIGGLEKENETGNISYDPDNHELMVKIRAEKINRIADFIPNQKIDQGEINAKVLVLGWGSTYGAITTAIEDLLKEGKSVAHIHLKHLNPFPKNLKELLSGFEKILVPELNNGQLIRLIRDQFLLPAIPYNKIKGLPFSAPELKEKINQLL